ncbi:lysophospholipid acyltransferase family protein [Bacteroides sp. 51]|uniref:lysophospholipid acyltransferase family protein n=1 Tax=Bacteroides sp. 51 TaxID=2302938 RepID=UPI0013D875B6|nr:lysophospholipid acyltransferase family protein [Bacteroides sp. 51]NDV84321.1 hemolysin [Bacteroides sp. 51]
MRKTLVDIEELQQAEPFFRSRFGTYAAKKLMKWVCMNKVNQVYSHSCHLSGAEFTSSLLKDPLIDIRYEIHNREILNDLPEDAFITVSNHPVGSIDGVILIDIFAALRSDFKVMVNGVLARIEAMEEHFISVQPDSNHQGANMKNVNGLRDAFRRIYEGHPMGFFPAGAISSYHKDIKAICDLPWVQSVMRLIRKTKVPVYPVFFDFYNSRFFYWLSSISWKIRSLRIPAEIFNKRGQVLDVYIGEPISPQTIQRIEDDEQLADFLLKKTYEAKKS